VSALAPGLQSFFTDRLLSQRRASPHTIASYRDALRLLLRFASERTRKAPCDLDVGDLDAPLVTAFLAHLEADRHNGVSTRNNRLAAIHSLFSYLALRHPEHAASIQRVLAIPSKRADRALVTYLTPEEVDALVGACDRSTWTGRRDHAMVVLAVQTGLRVSELTGLRCGDVVVGRGPHVHCTGKGRKQRRTPLLPLTVEVMEVWMVERRGAPEDPLFPTRTGRALSRDAIERRIAVDHRPRGPGVPVHRCQEGDGSHAEAHRGDAAVGLGG
jgi:integrase/recombinase XerD